MTRFRCAIYTRKSTEEGLEQGFNSLHAQREACEAYVRSQRSEGWLLMPDLYDDGAFSGGNMNRPALQRLLGDIDAGKVDVVVVYKVDRLTRSLLDFSHIVQRLEQRAVSFVSVTQAFNTTTSMGRLTLNVLLSFAQFEREVTAERIRDKIAASKKKGIWMGGNVPLGYDVRDRQLIVNESEAETVRWIYRTYLELQSVRRLKIAADRAGIRSKARVKRGGVFVEGCALSRGQFYNLLKNPIYAGKIRHGDKVYEGLHKRIIDRKLWDEVQARLAANAGDRMLARNLPSVSWLSRILVDDQDQPMVASHTTKAGRQYRYYISAFLMQAKPENGQGWRLPARDIERIVIGSVREVLEDPIKVLGILGITRITMEVTTKAGAAAQSLLDELDKLTPADAGEFIRPLIRRVRVSLYEVVVTIDRAALARALNMSVPDHQESPDYDIVVPVQLKRRGVETRIVVPGKEKEVTGPDANLPRLIAKAHHWFEQLKSGEVATIGEIARAENMNMGDVSRALPLAFLAPEIVTAILDGNYPADLTARKLSRLANLPMDWAEQRQLLGFSKPPSSP